MSSFVGRSLSVPNRLNMAFCCILWFFWFQNMSSQYIDVNSCNRQNMVIQLHQIKFKTELIHQNEINTSKYKHNF